MLSLSQCMNNRDPNKLYPFDYVLKPFLFLVPNYVRPNHVTVFRMFLIPIVAWFLITGQYAVGIPLFVFASFTDILDGTLARIRKQVTEWGTFYDPVADKMLIGAVVVLVVLPHIQPIIIAGVLIVESLIMFWGWRRSKTHGPQTANMWGKVKMWFEVLGVVFVLLALSFGWVFLLGFAEFVLIVAILFGFISLLTYSL